MAEDKEGLEGEQLMVDQEVRAVILAVLVVVGVFAVSQTLFPNRRGESFSELAILGPGKKMADYPRTVVAGQPFNLYLYLGNHEGHVMYYRVVVKLGDQESNVSDTQPLDAPSLASYESVLPQGGNRTIPISLTLSQPGVNQRLVFELHAYHTQSEEFRYHKRWCQLWMNVTQAG